MILAFAGKRRAGKSTLANRLAAALEDQHLTCVRSGFSDPIHLVTGALLEYAGCDEMSRRDLVNGSLRDSHIVPEFGTTVREFQQKLGTEFGRALIRADLWIDLWTSHLAAYHRNADVVLQDSLRFPNEAAAIRAQGGIICHLRQADAIRATDELDAHSSEDGIPKQRGDLLIVVNHRWSLARTEATVVKPLIAAITGGATAAADLSGRVADEMGAHPAITIYTGD